MTSPDDALRRPRRLETDSDLAAVRAQIPGLRELLHLNAGTKGLTAAPVTDALIELTREIERGWVGYCAVQGKAAAARARLARFFHVPETALAFTGNATESLNVALALPWERWGTPVDVLISDHEYPTTNLVFGYLQQTGRVRLIRYRLSPETGETLASLEANRTPAARLVVASHVDCHTGLRADVDAVCAWARERGLLSYIDGAQAAGQFAIDLSAMGCDLYISNGHKWLFGPNGVGLLYVRPGLEDDLTPSQVGAGTMHFDATARYEGVPRWVDGAHRFELQATRPAQVFAAMEAALDWYESFGPGGIEARQRRLAAWVKARLGEMPERFRLLSPPGWEQSSALVTVQWLRRGEVVSGDEIGAFCGKMFAQGKAFLRPVPEFDGLRLSMAYYHIEDDFERLFTLLESG